jgi:hypothetical protein
VRGKGRYRSARHASPCTFRTLQKGAPRRFTWVVCGRVQAGRGRLRYPPQATSSENGAAKSRPGRSAPLTSFGLSVISRCAESQMATGYSKWARLQMVCQSTREGSRPARTPRSGFPDSCFFAPSSRGFRDSSATCSGGANR